MFPSFGGAMRNMLPQQPGQMGMGGSMPNMMGGGMPGMGGPPQMALGKTEPYAGGAAGGGMGGLSQFLTPEVIAMMLQGAGQAWGGMQDRQLQYDRLEEEKRQADLDEARRRRSTAWVQEEKDRYRALPGMGALNPPRVREP